MNARIPVAAVLVVVLSLFSNRVVAQNVQSDAPASVALPVSQPAPDISYGVGEVVKMWQAGVGNDVIATYINNATAPYHLDADGIIYVKSAGLPSQMIQAMIQRDVQLQQQTAALPQPVAATPAPYVYMAPPQLPTAAAPAPSEDSKVVIIGSAPPPPSVEVTVIGSGYPGYNYYYPYRDTFCASSVVCVGSRCAGGFWR